jgi:hypothetical protein
MAIWLDGKFWGPWIVRNCVPEIEAMRDAMLRHMLPSLPDPVEGATAHSDAMWTLR